MIAPENLVLIPARSSSGAAYSRSQTADRRGVCIFSFLKLWSHWTDVH